MKLPITTLQRNLGDISNALIRGESIILTRNGKDFAKLSPIKNDEDRYAGMTEEQRKVQEIRDRVNAQIRARKENNG